MEEDGVRLLSEQKEEESGSVRRASPGRALEEIQTDGWLNAAGETPPCWRKTAVDVKVKGEETST